MRKEKQLLRLGLQLARNNNKDCASSNVQIGCTHSKWKQKRWRQESFYHVWKRRTHLQNRYLLITTYYQSDHFSFYLAALIIAMRKHFWSMWLLETAQSENFYQPPLRTTAVWVVLQKRRFLKFTNTWTSSRHVNKMGLMLNILVSFPIVPSCFAPT